MREKGSGLINLPDRENVIPPDGVNLERHGERVRIQHGRGHQQGIVLERLAWVDGSDHAVSGKGVFPRVWIMQTQQASDQLGMRTGVPVWNHGQ